MKTLSAAIFALAILITGTARVDAIDSVTERSALRKARGYYGREKGMLIPTGRFTGTVGNYYNEHAKVLLTPRPGKGKTKLKLDVWDGADHLTKIVRITARVRAGGKSVRLTGGRVKGAGLLPYGIRVQRGRVAGTVYLKSNQASMKTKFKLSGIDLANSNAPVAGTAKFVGEQE